MLRSFIAMGIIKNMESHFFFFYEPLIGQSLRKFLQKTPTGRMH